MDEILNIVKLSPPLALALALNVVGMAIKQSKLPDWTIVWILPALGAVFYPWIAVPSASLALVHHPTILNGIYGVLIGSASVGFNQLLRQTPLFKGKNDTSPTPSVGPPAK